VSSCENERVFGCKKSNSAGAQQGPAPGPNASFFFHQTRRGAPEFDQRTVQIVPESFPRRPAHQNQEVQSQTHTQEPLQQLHLQEDARRRVLQVDNLDLFEVC
jgi:hypothetical protein